MNQPLPHLLSCPINPRDRDGTDDTFSQRGGGERVEGGAGVGRAVTDSRLDQSQHTLLTGQRDWLKGKNNSRVSGRVEEANV